MKTSNTPFDCCKNLCKPICQLAENPVKFLELLKVCNCHEARHEDSECKEQENDGQVRKTEHRNYDGDAIVPYYLR